MFSQASGERAFEQKISIVDSTQYDTGEIVAAFRPVEPGLGLS
jgi:hypothetical protein